MKNLFDYATSELSQDAFLCWLFENYDCENEVVKKAAHALLGEMTGIKDLKVGTVTALKADRQVNHMDIVVDFCHNGKRYVLVIEDKTFSGDHHQFETYPESIKKIPKYQGAHCLFAFYKTDIVAKDEKERAENHAWKAFYLKEIYHFFESIPDSGCLISEQYREHIFNLYKKTLSVSNEPMEEWKDLLLFRTYIIQELFPLVESRQDVFDPPGVWGWHSYRSLGINRKRQDNINLSMEIKFNPKWDRAVVTIRVGEYDGDGVRIKLDDNFKELKQTIRNKINDCSCFQQYQGQQYCIGKEKERGKKQQRLLYQNGSQKITEEVRRFIDDFAKLCEAVNSEFKEHPELIETINFEKKNK